MALCDQYGRDGPKHPDCLTLAHFQSIAVDFAKHGESVPPNAFKKIRETQDRWPDFFEKDHEEMRISDGVLGHLYRDISNVEAWEAFILRDHQSSIKYEYDLSSEIIDQAKNKSIMHRYLSEVYSALVKPCVAKLKQIMLEFNFSSEAEIFSSDLRFKMFDNTSDNRYKCNMPLKTEDSMSRLKSKLSRITERYTAKFNEIVETHEKGHGKWGVPDQDARINIAVATYLATYFDVNQATKDYYALH